MCVRIIMDLTFWTEIIILFIYYFYSTFLPYLAEVI